MSDASAVSRKLDTHTLGISANESMEDAAWISVIHKMESIYSDLLHYQVELESKNAALEDAHQFIDSVLSSMSEVLIACDVNGNILQVNRALCEAIDSTAEALIGRSFCSLFPATQVVLVEDFPQRVRSESISEVEVDLQHSNGSGIPMAFHCSPRFDHNERYCGLVLTGRPLGELKRAYDQLNLAHADLKTAQNQLIQSEKMASLGRLVAGVAHELNNPISIIYGNMFALQRYESLFRDYISSIARAAGPAGQMDRGKQRKIDRMLADIGPLIEGSVEGAERVSEIVQNLLRFSIPQAQSRTRFRLEKVVSTALQWVLRCSTVAPTVNLAIDQELTLVNHEGHVHQILVNLLQNALDALENKKDARLEIWTSVEQDTVTLTVRDNGPGIAESDLVRLFDPFFTRKAVGKGTGLGLYISYGLAKEQCNGELRVENDPAGGARFLLQLPVEARS